MPHLVLPPFDSNIMQAHFIFTSKSGTHESEEQNKGGKMEVDLVVALEL